MQILHSVALYNPPDTETLFSNRLLSWTEHQSHSRRDSVIAVEAELPGCMDYYNSTASPRFSTNQGFNGSVLVFSSALERFGVQGLQPNTSSSDQTFAKPKRLH